MELMQHGRTLANKKDIINILLLVLITVAIYYPLFYSEYLYTDESVQLWLYKRGSGFQMFIGQGRYITEKLFQWLFSKADTVHDVIQIRLFSFFGWVVCIPIWYMVIKKVVRRENLPSQLIFFSSLYLICTPPFTIYVAWASCLEQFIATTAGLLSGYILYASIQYENGRVKAPMTAVAMSIVVGVLSLFTYQNGFGCFLLPFILHIISRPKSFRTVFIAVAVYLFIYVVYYFLFKYSLRINNMEAAGRTKLSVDLFPKIRFFFGRPLANSFHFTYLFNEKSLVGVAASAIILAGWAITTFYQSRLLPAAHHVKTFVAIILLFALIYLPTLIVKEMYASNRTLFALNMAVFFAVANTLLLAVGKYKVIVASVVSMLFVMNAWYNFNRQFLIPVKNEYQQVRSFIEKNYKPAINTVYFIRPHENFFVSKYRITRSWDEFGVPSTFFSWVPEFFTKQVIFEKTKSRQVAESLAIKNWISREEFVNIAPQLSSNVMVIDVEQILK